MTIHSVGNLKPGDLFTTDGRDVWEVSWVMNVPSIGLKNVRTGEERSAGIGGLILEPFVPLQPTEPIPKREDNVAPWERA